MKQTKIKEHKEIKNFDVKILKEILNARDKFNGKQHNRRKELIFLRGDTSIKVIWEKDKAHQNQFERKVKLSVMR